MTIQVVAAPYLGLYGYFIGRPSVLASPFNIGLHGKRTAVIEKYRAWLWEQIKKEYPIFMDELNRLLELWRCVPQHTGGWMMKPLMKGKTD